MSWCRWVCALALLAGTALPAGAQGTLPAAPQVFLMTMGPGAAVHERFGHNAIWIRDTTTGLDLVYNYGTFDFAEPGFIGRFVFGRPLYWLAVADLQSTLRTYAYFQRDVMVQELALPPGRRVELALRLAENLQPANRSYIYDYYRDNCSTRVRDMLDLVLGGALRTATEGVRAEGTLRFHTQRSVSNDPLLYVGILAAQGMPVDRPLDQWGEMFLPAKVQARVRELTVTDTTGQAVPLVVREDTLLAIGAFAVEPTRPDWSGRLFLLGALLGVVSLTGMVRGAAGMAGRVVATLWLLLSGIGGVILLFLWFGTAHVASADNWNVGLLSPLALLALPAVWRQMTAPGRVVTTSMGLLVAGSFSAMVAAFAGAQVNGELVALALPANLAVVALALGLSARRAPARPSPR